MNKADKIAYALLGMSLLLLLLGVFSLGTPWQSTFPISERLFAPIGMLSLCALYITPFGRRSSNSSYGAVDQNGFQRVL